MLRTGLLAVALLAGCGPRCLKSHQQANFIPAHNETYYTYVWIGKLMIPISHDRWVPDHTEYPRICDEYEVK